MFLLIGGPYSNKRSYSIERTYSNILIYFFLTHSPYICYCYSFCYCFFFFNKYRIKVLFWHSVVSQKSSKRPISNKHPPLRCLKVPQEKKLQLCYRAESGLQLQHSGFLRYTPQTPTWPCAAEEEAKQEWVELTCYPLRCLDLIGSKVQYNV